MDLIANYENLQDRTSNGLAQVKAAATESRQELEQRINEAQVDLDAATKEAKQEAGDAADRTQSKWAQMKVDANAKMDDIKAKIDKRNDQIGADIAASDAKFAEVDAADAISYAEWVVDNARLAVLDALDARAYAGERAKEAAAKP